MTPEQFNSLKDFANHNNIPIDSVDGMYCCGMEYIQILEELVYCIQIRNQ